ncbi:alpha/beta hydrolase [Paraburkholderia mimosarum]|uniref:alpha/beta hydrolase n=1 Tax=Paraburkholderia mimosarum TaxID=312026 RepID=UPI00192E431D|nr:alpha/beta hydrolase [Paraburkholderia mimosarum]
MVQPAGCCRGRHGDAGNGSCGSVYGTGCTQHRARAWCFCRWVELEPGHRQAAAHGYHVTAVQNPLTSLADDVAATESVLRRQSGDVLLVGHSWAGAVITQAGNAANVKGLVYLSALVPDDGESVADLLQRLDAPMTGLAPDAQGLIWLDDARQFQHVMAADIPFPQARKLASVQQPVAAAFFTGKVQHAAWHDKPVWYVRTTNDNALRAAVQQAIAQHIGATVTSIRSSHMSMLSHPDDIAKLIDQAARKASQ